MSILIGTKKREEHASYYWYNWLQ